MAMHHDPASADTQGPVSERTVGVNARSRFGAEECTGESHTPRAARHGMPQNSPVQLFREAGGWIASVDCIESASGLATSHCRILRGVASRKRVRRSRGSPRSIPVSPPCSRAVTRKLSRCYDGVEAPVKSFRRAGNQHRNASDTTAWIGARCSAPRTVEEPSGLLRSCSSATCSTAVLSLPRRGTRRRRKRKAA
jgi:hypothetical protein